VIETYRPFPKQQEFHRSAAKYRLFGGAAGPGKSRALVEEAVVQAHEVPGANTLLLRRTFPELEESLILPFRRFIFPQWERIGARYNESKHIVYWPNGSTTRFGYCQRENDVYQYQGAEYLFIGVDELTLFTLRQWQFLTSRNRCPIPGSFPNMAGATNPGNIGHAWVKKLFIDKQPAPGMENADQYDPSEYDFISARVSDNPIYANDAAYIKTLRALPTHLRKAFLEGDWNVFAGQYFDIFDRGRHACHSSAIELKPWWPRWISGDWGHAHPSCIHWHAKDGDRVITYRELHGKGIGEKQLGRMIVDLCAADKDSTGRMIPMKQFFFSPDAFAERSSQHTIAREIGDVLAEAGIPRPVLADNDRIGGARLLYQLLDADLLVIFEDQCPKLIECLPTLIHDELRPEDVLKVDAAEGSIGDDPYDSQRYGLKSMLGEAKVPIEVQLKERMAEAKEEGVDRTNRAILAKKFLQQHAASKRPTGGGRLRWMRRPN
jgi:terminase large subunit-like protein